jgi:CBS domain containing-hemolysin-like protein
MYGIDIKAVALATLAVFGIDFVSGLVLFGVFAEIPMNASEEQARAAALALGQNSGYLTTALILGTVSTVVGGYLVARMARQVPYFNALAFAVLGILLGLLLSADLPTWFMIVGFGLSIPAALCGAYLNKRSSRPNAGS